MRYDLPSPLPGVRAHLEIYTSPDWCWDDVAASGSVGHAHAEDLPEGARPLPFGHVFGKGAYWRPDPEDSEDSEAAYAYACDVARGVVDFYDATVVVTVYGLEVGRATVSRWDSRWDDVEATGRTVADDADLLDEALDEAAAWAAQSVNAVHVLAERALLRRGRAAFGGAP